MRSIGGEAERSIGRVEAGLARLRCDCEQLLVPLPTVPLVWGGTREETREAITLEDLHRLAMSAVERNVRPRIERLRSQQGVERDEIGAKVCDEVTRWARAARPPDDVTEGGAHDVNVFDGSKWLYIAKIAVARQSLLRTHRHAVEREARVDDLGNEGSRRELLQSDTSPIRGDLDDHDVGPAVRLVAASRDDDQALGEGPEGDEGLRPVEPIPAIGRNATIDRKNAFTWALVTHRPAR